MDRSLLLVLSLLLCGVPAGASEHLATPDAVKARIQGAQAARQEDIASLDTFLSSEAGGRAAARAGQDPSRLREAIASLSDQELHDLALRTARLKTDPAAGLTHDVEELLIIFLIVALVVIIIKNA